MTDDSDADVLAVLELLANASPEGAVEELVSAVESAGATAERLRRLKTAEHLAGRVHARFRHTQRHVLGLTDLVQSARDLMLAQDVNSLLDVLTAHTRQLLMVDLSSVAVVDEDQASAVLRSVNGHTSGALTGFRFSKLERLIADAAPVCIVDGRADLEFKANKKVDDLLRQESITSILAVPLGRKENTVLILFAAHRTTRHFTADEVSLAESLGKLGLAMYENLREHEQMVADFALTEQFIAGAESALRDLTDLTSRHDRIMTQLLNGLDPSAFAAEVAERLTGAVSVYGRDGRLVAQAGDMPDAYDSSLAIAEAWSSHEPRMLDEGSWVAPIFAAKEPLGVLMVHTEQPLKSCRLQYLSLAAKTAGVLLMLFDAKATALTAQRNELLSDLLSSGEPAIRKLADRAHSLGIEPTQPYVVVVTGAVGRDVQSFWAAQYSRRLGGLSTTFEEITVLILPGEDASQAAKTVRDYLLPLAGEGVTVGAAGPTRGLQTVREVYLEARRCLDVMVALDTSGGAGSARDMGFLGLLLSKDGDADEFVRSVLGPVIDYDTQRTTELIPTLENYYAAGASPTYAARKLHVHRNTVERRLERIAELLGPTWQQADRSLEIQLALRIARTREALRQ